MPGVAMLPVALNGSCDIGKLMLRPADCAMPYNSPKMRFPPSRVFKACPPSITPSARGDVKRLSNTSTALDATVRPKEASANLSTCGSASGGSTVSVKVAAGSHWRYAVICGGHCNVHRCPRRRGLACR